MTNIAIVGAGWLGLPLTQRLHSEGQSVFGTRTTSERLEELEKLSLPCFALKLDSEQSVANPLVINQLQSRNVQTLVGAFPPGFKKGQGKAYANQWQALVNSALKAGVKKIVMISSTSAYSNANQTMFEHDACLSLAENNDLFSENARTMLIAEQSLIDSGIDYVILRCSGLFGPNRHPARFVSKMTSISNVAPVNMVHLEDVINAVIFSLSKITNQVVNVTSPNTVTKYEFYNQAILNSDEESQMPELNNIPAKRISAEKIVQLGFQFQYENVVDGLSHC